MFLNLNESYDYDFYMLDESVEPTEAGILRAHIEFSESMEALTMSMIALEHTAIVNEDASLLAEGGREFLNKAKGIITGIAKKIAAWFQGIIAKVQTKLTNITKLVSLAEKNSFNPKKEGAS